MADPSSASNTPMYPPRLSHSSSGWGSGNSYQPSSAGPVYPHPAATMHPHQPALPAGYHPSHSYHAPLSGVYPPQSPLPGTPQGTQSLPHAVHPPPQHSPYYGYPPPPQSYAPYGSPYSAPLQTQPGPSHMATLIPHGSLGPHQASPQPRITPNNSLLPPYSPTAGVQGVAEVRTAEVRLEILCENLRDRDVISKSDPCAVVFLEEKRVGSLMGYPGSMPPGPPSQHPMYMNMEQAAAASPYEVSHWREVGRTESIKDNLNPHFSVHVTVPYRFEELQNIRIGLWDIDSASAKLDRHDFLGDIRTTVGDLVASGVTSKDLAAPGRNQKTLLGGRRNLGKITIIVHENQQGGKLLVKGRFSGKKLAKRDLFSSDPYIIFTQLGVRGEQSRSQVFKTEVVLRNRNPVWRPVKFKVDLPKGGNHSHIKLELKCNDKDHMSCDDEIGIARCTLQELEQVDKLPLIYTKRKNRRGYTNSGHILVQNVKAVRMPSLIEYLQGGLKVNFSVAVDLTASNGDPRDPNSLHHDQSYGQNQYLRALKAIGTIIQPYAPNDHMFAAYGFGAELPGQSGTAAGSASFCFPLNLAPDPRCRGIEGIIDAYTRVLRTVRLSGPTNFAPVIEKAARTAAARRNSSDEQNYDLLLILTDGVVTDFNRTVEQIIDASYNAPLSIIIIGVGNANFEKMERLDGDNQLLRTVDGKREANRDIVQFVPFREHATQPPDRLAATVLSEMPQNIVDYFISSRDPPIMPGQAPMVPGL